MTSTTTGTLGERRGPLDVLWNVWSTVGSIVGGFTLLNMTQGFLALKRSIVDLLAAWDAVVSPVGRLLFGWIRLHLPFRLPVGTEDYLVLGLIAGAAASRAIWFAMREINSTRAVVIPIANRLTSMVSTFEGEFQDLEGRSGQSISSSLEFMAGQVAYASQVRETPIFDVSELSRLARLLKDVTAKLSQKIRQAAETLPTGHKVRLSENMLRDLNVLRRDWIAFLTSSAEAARHSTPQTMSIAEAVAYWPLLPIWPLTFGWYALRVRGLANQRFAIFIAHAFGFVLAFAVIVAANYAFFWLK